MIGSQTRSTIGIGAGGKAVGNVQTNPVATTVLTDTGQLPAGEYLFGLILYTTVAAVIDIQHRNAGNSANIDFIRINIATAGTEYPLFPSKITIAQNERIRIYLPTGITGDIQGSVFYVKTL